MYFLGQKDKARETFLLAIKESKDTKYNKSFEPFFYMEKLCAQRGEEKEGGKYRKMYLSRLQKYSETALFYAVKNMEDEGEESFV